MKVPNNMRIVFLCSGGGGNLRFVKQAIEKGWFGTASLVGVLTDRECGANEYARLYGIDEKCIDFTDPNQAELVKCLERYQPDIVITTVHRILNPEVVKKFRDKLINLHYSLLPAFGGLMGARPVKEAIAYGAQFTGVTVHLVDESLDGGKPLVQAAIPLRSTDNIDHLMDLVFRCGCLSLASAINSCFRDIDDDADFIEEVVQLKDRNCLFSKKINLPLTCVKNEEFWEEIKSTK